jgi:hypothetical protein
VTRTAARATHAADRRMRCIGGPGSRPVPGRTALFCGERTAAARGYVTPARSLVIGAARGIWDWCTRLFGISGGLTLFIRGPGDAGHGTSRAAATRMKSGLHDSQLSHGTDYGSRSRLIRVHRQQPTRSDANSAPWIDPFASWLQAHRWSSDGCRCGSHLQDVWSNNRL